MRAELAVSNRQKQHRSTFNPLVNPKVPQEGIWVPETMCSSPPYQNVAHDLIFSAWGIVVSTQRHRHDRRLLRMLLPTGWQVTQPPRFSVIWQVRDLDGHVRLGLNYRKRVFETHIAAPVWIQLCNDVSAETTPVQLVSERVYHLGRMVYTTPPRHHAPHPEPTTRRMQIFTNQ